jgi:hypothetical protein
MLIHSDFHDYYDAALGTAGVDTSIVYHRFRRTILSKEISPASATPEGWLEALQHGRVAMGYYSHAPLWHYDAGDSRSLRSGSHLSPARQAARSVYRIEREYLMGFCGEVWYGMELTAPKQGNTRFFLFDDEIGAFVREHGLDKPEPYDPFAGSSADSVNAGSAGYVGGDAYAAWLDLRARVLRYRSSGAAKRVHREHNAPAFVYVMHGQGALVVNPCLREFGFMRVKDTYTAFQELQDYIGGILGQPEPAILHVSERDSLKQHGFDEQWSFRNPDPPRRKQGRKQRRNKGR